MRKLTLYVAVIAALAVARTDAAQVTVLASNGVREALIELIPQFEKASGHRVQVVWDGTLNIKKRIGSGEVADLVVVPAEDVDGLIASGGLTAGSRVDLAKSIIGVAVRAGLAKPDLSTSESLKRALLAAKSIAYSDSSSGTYLSTVGFKKLGIADEIAGRTRKVRGPPSGEVVAAVVARGEAEIGFQQVPELLHVPGVDFVGTVPSDIQPPTLFVGALPKDSQQPDLAVALLRFLSSAEAAGVITKAGLKPLAAR